MITLPSGSDAPGSSGLWLPQTMRISDNALELMSTSTKCETSRHLSSSSSDLYASAQHPNLESTISASGPYMPLNAQTSPITDFSSLFVFPPDGELSRYPLFVPPLCAEDEFIHHASSSFLHKLFVSLGGCSRVHGATESSEKEEEKLRGEAEAQKQRLLLIKEQYKAR
ncbi:uncharacterized protein BDR25DRAFT_352969 [Lindgomyces ingoldianus]|uniref:Uncharacterized protein n=1 Tax=Lindgomyces ingoldianus TaxID=673940 RepID=A0ACB6R040_9PLEO|nr:uncharacterized protein BDR25DRAFT_352969 [Lindgomyces ingoldianus]KAF2472659.1 hypothetical protein BDR25DRAFT_352969 [Lindgomyces ingoldianus]